MVMFFKKPEGKPAILTFGRFTSLIRKEERDEKGRIKLNIIIYFKFPNFEC